MATTTKAITGGKEVADFLKKFGLRFETNVMRAGTVEGAKVIAMEAKSNAIGLDLNHAAKLRLVHAITYKRSRSRPGKVVAGVYMASVPKREYQRGDKSKVTRDDPAVWYRWIEYGTDTRWTGTRGTGIRQRRVNTGKRVSRGRMKEQPFLRPAFDMANEPAIDAVMAYARKRLDREVRKLAREAKKAAKAAGGSKR